ncbi:MAG TPA: glycosyltransferase family 2 protein [Candidatus Saccharimonadales bacterium]
MKKINSLPRRVLIVIPTYNEAQNIKPLVAAIGNVFAGQKTYAADMLFVDDTSPDGTADIVRQLQGRNKHIYLLSGTKAGLGRAYVRGFEYGLGLGNYFAVVMMDADLSHDPAVIPSMLGQLEQGADYVIGSRYIKGGTTEYARHRQLNSMIANLVAKHFIDIKTNTKDLTAGFKAIRRTALETIPLRDIAASGYVFQVSLLYEFAKRGFVVREVPITFHERHHGVSKLGLHDILEFLRLTYSLNPQSRVRRMIRFATVGASGTLVNLAVLITLVNALHTEVMIAYAVALETSIISNFFLNHWFTFRSVREDNSPSLAAQIAKFGRYNLVALAGATIAWLIFSFCYKALGMWYVPADLLGIVASMSWNYWLSVRLVWRIIDTPPTDPEPHHELQEA